MLNNQEFLAAVCGQVRSKQAHRRIILELQHHLDDQTESFIAQGLTPDTAAAKAILEMGDPVLVGQQLDREYRPKPPYLLFIGLLSLLAVGLGLQTIVGDAIHPRDLFAILMAVAAFGVTYFMDFTCLARPKICWATILGICLLCICATRTVLGRDVFAFSFLALPTFFLFILLLPVLAGMIWIYANKGTKGVAIIMAVTAITFFISLRSGVSFSIIYCLSVVALAAYAIFSGIFQGKKWCNALLLLSPLLPALLLFFYQPSYFFSRIMFAFAPLQDAKGAGFMAHIIQQGLSQAGLWSGGQNAALANFKHYPDLLFSTIINQYGWAIVLLAIGLIGIFFAILIKYCLKQRNHLSRLISLSVTLAFLCQALSFIIYNLGFTLISPVPLPFLSSGNTSLVINALLMGLLASVLRTGHMTDCTPHPAKTPQAQ